MMKMAAAADKMNFSKCLPQKFCVKSAAIVKLLWPASGTDPLDPAL
jgi:hypothetical protein